MGKVLGSYGITEQAESAYICFLADQLAQGQFQAQSFKNGVLTLQVENSYLAQEIQFTTQKIISDLNKKIGTLRVQRIRFKIQKSN